MDRIYLDYAATTPLDPIIPEKMTPFFAEDLEIRHPSIPGAKKQKTLWKSARESVADSLYCDPEEIVFTSGGSESDNLALRGVALCAGR